MSRPLELVDDSPAAQVNDAATRLALQRLAASRERLGAWVEQIGDSHAGGGSLFQPRSATMRTLMSLGTMRVPWLRWGFSAFMLLRSLRRR